MFVLKIGADPLVPLKKNVAFWTRFARLTGGGMESRPKIKYLQEKLHTGCISLVIGFIM